MTVMRAFPSPTAVIFPDWLTVATSSSSDSHKTSVLSASEGITSAESWAVLPFCRVRLFLLRLTPVTSPPPSELLPELPTDETSPFVWVPVPEPEPMDRR